MDTIETLFYQFVEDGWIQPIDNLYKCYGCFTISAPTPYWSKKITPPIARWVIHFKEKHTSFMEIYMQIDLHSFKKKLYLEQLRRVLQSVI